MKNSQLILYAPNIHVGGGAILLKEIIDMAPSGVGVTLILNEKFKGADCNLPLAFKKYFFPNTLLGRLRSEWYLRKISSCKDKVVCFHNIPPIFSNGAHITIFVQNRLVVDDELRSRFNIKTRIRLYIESLLLRYRARKNVSYIVQTDSMERKLRDFLGTTNTSIRVIPFASIRPSTTLQKGRGTSTYIYIASAEPHKNHKNLLKAWRILAGKYNRRLTLLLTLPKSAAKLYMEVDKEVKDYGLDIINLGDVSHIEALEHLSSAKALIYPSMTESFGLPLIEATSLNVPIIASELDYVRDVSQPVETFDPTSPISIARAVARYEGIDIPPRKVQGPSSFWDYV